MRSHKEKTAQIRGANFDKIRSEASARWTQYEPTPKHCRSAGVDSSWNKRAYQGIDLYVVDAVAVTTQNEILATEWESSIGSARSEALETKAMSMEAAALAKGQEKVDIICIDGSLVSRLSRGSQAVASETIRVLKNCSNAVFVSKTSDSRSQFGKLDSRAGDIYYFSHAGELPGFSKPVQGLQYRHNCTMTVTEVYTRLKENTPVIKIELVAGIDGASDLATETKIKKTIDMICYHSIAGYPYCLKLAHENCKISNKDIDRLASIYGLQNEPGARDALNE